MRLDGDYGISQNIEEIHLNISKTRIVCKIRILSSLDLLWQVIFLWHIIRFLSDYTLFI